MQKGEKYNSQANTRHVAFHLPFGCFLDRYLIHKNYITNYCPFQMLRHENMIPGVNSPQ